MNVLPRPGSELDLSARAVWGHRRKLLPFLSCFCLVRLVELLCGTEQVAYFARSSWQTSAPYALLLGVVWLLGQTACTSLLLCNVVEMRLGRCCTWQQTLAEVRLLLPHDVRLRQIFSLQLLATCVSGAATLAVANFFSHWQTLSLSALLKAVLYLPAALCLAAAASTWCCWSTCVYLQADGATRASLAPSALLPSWTACRNLGGRYVEVSWLTFLLGLPFAALRALVEAVEAVQPGALGSSLQGYLQVGVNLLSTPLDFLSYVLLLVFVSRVAGKHGGVPS